MGGRVRKRGRGVCCALFRGTGRLTFRWEGGRDESFLLVGLSLVLLVNLFLFFSTTLVDRWVGR